MLNFRLRVEDRIGGPPLKRYFHIGLPGTEPDLARENISERYCGIRGFYTYLERPARPRGLNASLPVAPARHGSCRAAVPGCFYRDTHPRCSLPPDRDGAPLLEDHAVGKEWRQSQRCSARERAVRESDQQ